MFPLGCPLTKHQITALPISIYFEEAVCAHRHEQLTNHKPLQLGRAHKKETQVNGQLIYSTKKREELLLI